MVEFFLSWQSGRKEYPGGFVYIIRQTNSLPVSSLLTQRGHEDQGTSCHWTRSSRVVSMETSMYEKLIDTISKIISCLYKVLSKKKLHV